MKLISKKNALFFAALLATGVLFAKPTVTDFKGSEMQDYPKWVELLDKAAGKNDSGKITYSKSTKKLYNKLNVGKDKVLFYSVQNSGDKDFALTAAQGKVKELVSSEISADAEKELQKRLEKAVKLSGSGVNTVAGFSRAADFWEELDGGSSYNAYSVWQVSLLNLDAAKAKTVSDYLKKSGLDSKEESGER